VLFYKKYPLKFKWAVPMLFRSYRKIMTSRVLCWMFVFDSVSEKPRKNKNPAKNEPRPVRMVLLENFGPAFAEAASRRQGRTLAYPTYDARRSKVSEREPS
jgi:hypothetical protein